MRALIVNGGRIHAVTHYGPVPTDDVIWVRTGCQMDLSVAENLGMTSDKVQVTCTSCADAKPAFVLNDAWMEVPPVWLGYTHMVEFDDEVDTLCGQPMYGTKWHVVNGNRFTKNHVPITKVTCKSCLTTHENRISA